MSEQCHSANFTGAMPVPGNLIPVADLNPQAVAILKDFPAPTNDGLLGNYAAVRARLFQAERLRYPY